MHKAPLYFMSGASLYKKTRYSREIAGFEH